MHWLKSKDITKVQMGVQLEDLRSVFPMAQKAAQSEGRSLNL
jgi:hypothetical protein